MAFCRLKVRTGGNEGFLNVRTDPVGCLVVRFDECDYEVVRRPRVITVGVRRRPRDEREARDLQDMRDILAAVLEALSVGR